LLQKLEAALQEQMLQLFQMQVRSYVLP
jgi:hypothetical protein